MFLVVRSKFVLVLLVSSFYFFFSAGVGGAGSVARSAGDSKNTIETDFSRSSIKFPELVKYTLNKELDSTYKQMSGIAYHEAREMVLVTGQQ